MWGAVLFSAGKKCVGWEFARVLTSSAKGTTMGGSNFSHTQNLSFCCRKEVRLMDNYTIGLVVFIVWALARLIR